MSGREGLSTYRTSAGGTIHPETDNPALLALLRENSTTDHPPHPVTSAPGTLDTTTAASSSPHSTGTDPAKASEQAYAPAQSGNSNSARQPKESAQVQPQVSQSPENHTTQPSQSQESHTSQPALPLARSISQTIIRDDPSDPNRSRQKSANRSLAVSPLSRIVPSETDSASSELACLVGTPSRKSLVLSAAVSEADFGEEADDEAGDTEDAGNDVDDTDTPVASPSQFNEQNGDRSDQRHTDGQSAKLHAPSAPGVSAAATALPPGGRASVTSFTNPSILRGPGVASPDLNHPEHQRFVTPYASRRLKDKPVCRSSAVSFALIGERGVSTTLNVPKHQSWSATQAARLRAGAGAEARENTDPPPVKAAPDLGTPTPRNKDSVEDGPNPVDSLDLPTDRSAETVPPPAHLNQSRGVTPVDDDETRRSTLPPPIEGQWSNTPTPRAGPDFRGGNPEQPSASKPAESNQAPFVTPTPRSNQNSARLTVDRGEQGPTSLSLATGSVPNSARVTPVSILKKQREPEQRSVESAVSRVYVETPTFTREEEEQYRFVSSRLENEEDDAGSPDHPTYRGLDQQAVTSMEGGAAVGIRATRKPFKQVRYQDDDRYEDREQIYQYSGGQPQPAPPQRQYVLKSKGGSAQAQDNRPAQPVRSLTLPSGPSYDPADEEDLKRETTYQQELRTRVSSIQRTAEETLVPRLRLGESEEFRDSLDIPEDVELDSERHNQHRDSIDVYEQQRLQKAMHNTQWEDPPAPPMAAPQRPNFQPQRQGYGNSLRQGYAEPQRGYADPQQQGYGGPQRQGYADFQPQYEDPQRPGYGDIRRQGYIDLQRPEYADNQRQGYADNQRQGYEDHRRGYGDPQRQGYGDAPQQGYGDPNNQGGYQDAYYQDQPGDFPQGQYGHTPSQPQPMRGDPRYNQHPQQGPPPPQQGGYYAQETQPPPQAYHQRNPPGPQQQQYQHEDDSRFQGSPQNQGHYMERGAGRHQGYAGSNAEPQDGFYLTEPRGYPQGPGPVYRQDYDAMADEENQVYSSQNPAPYDSVNTDRYQLEDHSQNSTAREKRSPREGLPHKPPIDYIAHNKYDYGRTHKRSYKKIHEVKKEEEEKLSQVFIQPKVKGKGQKSRNSSPSRYPAIAENAGEEGGPPAEELWAQRSASLARAKNSKLQGGKKKPGSNTSMLSNAHRLYHSDNSIPNTAQQRPPLQPANPQNQMQLVPAPQQSAQLTPAQSPPFRQPLDLKPISQQLITEDGQRISVDVNLRLISPPVGGESEMEGYGRQPIGNQRHTGLQYPMGNGQPNGTPDENDFPPGRYSADDILSSKNAYGGGMGVTGNHGGYASDSNHDYSSPVYTTNPYKKIPPIPSSGDGEAPRSAPVQSEGSYMLSYLREKEKEQRKDRPWYKVYGLKDYKRMQNEVRLGTRTLGPDLESNTYKERREKKQRQLEYAKGVKDKNAKDLLTKKPPTFPRSKEEDDMLSKRKLAVEYAKNVPKPTVKPKANPYNSYELASKLSPIAKPAARPQQPGEQEPSVEVLDLQKLHERHEQDKRSADLIRQKAQGLVT